jgi:Domain of unknown function (DUF4430)
MKYRPCVSALARAGALLLVAVGIATSQESGKTKEGKQPLPAMTLKVYDPDGNVLVNVKRNVLPRPKNNAFDVMRAIVAVDFDTYAGEPTANPPSTGGAFVNSIAGVVPPPMKYWFLYVDGVKPKDKGICDITINNDTLIEWKIEEYKADSK